MDKNVWRADIVICTVDKAASLVTYLLSARTDRVGIVVVDEVHSGSSFQGYSIENMLTKLRYIAKHNIVSATAIRAVTSNW